MNADEALHHYGLHPTGPGLTDIRAMLVAETEAGVDDQDTELMLLCCVQLFNAGDPGDILTIWQAKKSSFDAHCGIDIQLLCGAGLETTKNHLAAHPDPAAAAALHYLRECEATGDFDEFTVAAWSDNYASYYSA
ncbi:hypothetical protein [Symbioplanes lichenis]|uniref:hypothetical protein n=1 Tax=Symbioplanes lichenis TaxID=1629072 RepID=UPI0027396A8F|nr:hypothetical protein [Actinoplanes lichenis]